MTPGLGNGCGGGECANRESSGVERIAWKIRGFEGCSGAFRMASVQVACPKLWSMVSAARTRSAAARFKIMYLMVRIDLCLGCGLADAVALATDELVVVR